MDSKQRLLPSALLVLMPGLIFFAPVDQSIAEASQIDEAQLISQTWEAWDQDLAVQFRSGNRFHLYRKSSGARVDSIAHGRFRLDGEKRLLLAYDKTRPANAPLRCAWVNQPTFDAKHHLLCNSVTRFTPRADRIAPGTRSSIEGEAVLVWGRIQATARETVPMRTAPYLEAHPAYQCTSRVQLSDVACEPELKSNTQVVLLARSLRPTQTRNRYVFWYYIEFQSHAYDEDCRCGRPVQSNGWVPVYAFGD